MVEEVDPASATMTTMMAAVTTTTTEHQEGCSGSANPLPSTKSGRRRIRARAVDPRARGGSVTTCDGGRNLVTGGGRRIWAMAQGTGGASDAGARAWAMDLGISFARKSFFLVASLT
uniref:Uncharacterized protein n=2 Tax=Oryza TaxID=4527 RepID=A0A0D3GS42_9ORYZ